MEGKTSVQMARTITLVSLIFCLSYIIISCTKEKPKLTARAIQVITENYCLYEPNPTHSDEAKKLNEMFRYALNNRSKLEPSERKNIYIKSMALSKENDEAESAIEDAVDQNRFIMRGSITMATAALVSEPKEALKLFERAEKYLNESGRTSEPMEVEYSALLVLEALYLSEYKLFNDSNKKTMIKTINSFVNLSTPLKTSFVEVIREF
jgi:hypothetical protein